jgi:hypothetical protein
VPCHQPSAAQTAAAQAIMQFVFAYNSYVLECAAKGDGWASSRNSGTGSAGSRNSVAPASALSPTYFSATATARAARHAAETGGIDRDAGGQASEGEANRRFLAALKETQAFAFHSDKTS